MKLIDFPYTTTNRLVKYSKLVTKAIASFNRKNASEIGTIAHDPNYGLPPNEDRQEYWDDENEDITFGRYLLFTKKKKSKDDKKEEIPFWTGFSSKQAKIEFIIWFEDKNLLVEYIKKFDELKERGEIEKFRQYELGKKGEIWIPMKDSELKDLCNSCAYCRRQTLKVLWYDVLGVL